jgi:hypothetical protein
MSDALQDALTKLREHIKKPEYEWDAHMVRTLVTKVLIATSGTATQSLCEDSNTCTWCGGPRPTVCQKCAAAGTHQGWTALKPQ